MKIIFVRGKCLSQGYFEAEAWINPDTDRVAFAWQWMRARFTCCQLVQDLLTSIQRGLTDARG